MKTDPARCQAYQASDQMICPTCHMGWDVNDPEPPECPRTGWVTPSSCGHVITVDGRQIGSATATAISTTTPVHPVHTEEEMNAWAARLGQHLPRIAREADRRQTPNRTNQQRRADDPGEFKVGNRTEGRRFLDRALGILAAKTDRLRNLPANPGDKPKKE